MNVWLIYVSIGACLLVVMLLISKLQDFRRGTMSSELRRALSGPQSRREWLVDKVLVPAMAGLAVVIAWPVVSVWAIKEWFAEARQSKERERRREEGIFRIRRENLVRITSVTEVEQAEMVVDPLQAVPQKPFGHLHSVWTEFLQYQPHDAELWQFASDWKTEWSSVFARSGYVWVKDEACSPWVLTSHISKEAHDE